MDSEFQIKKRKLVPVNNLFSLKISCAFKVLENCFRLCAQSGRKHKMDYLDEVEKLFSALPDEICDILRVYASLAWRHFKIPKIKHFTLSYWHLTPDLSWLYKGYTIFFSEPNSLYNLYKDPITSFLEPCLERTCQYLWSGYIFPCPLCHFWLSFLDRAVAYRMTQSIIFKYKDTGIWVDPCVRCVCQEKLDAHNVVMEQFDYQAEVSGKL
jgi:hypothetical protein